MKSEARVERDDEETLREGKEESLGGGMASLWDAERDRVILEWIGRVQEQLRKRGRERGRRGV